MAKKWSDRQLSIKKELAIRMYAATGNLVATAEQAGVTPMTLRRWKGQEWWPERLAEFRAGVESALNERQLNIVNKAMEVVVDRLENGDFVWDVKQQRMIRVPVSMKNATTAAAVLNEQRTKAELQRQKLANKQNDTQDISATLANIASAFMSIAKGKPEKLIIDGKITEQIPVDSLAFQLRKEIQEGNNT